MHSSSLFRHWSTRLLLVAGVCWFVPSGCRDAAKSPSPDEPTSQASGPEEPPGTPDTPAFDPDAEGAAIINLFETFCAAVRAHDGQAAVEHVDENTIERYESLRALAVAASQGGDPADVAGRSIGDRLMMYQILAIFGADHLADMDGRSLLRFGIDTGTLLQTTCAEGAVGQLQVTNESIATMSLRDAQGQETDGSLRFVARDGHWKIDLTAPMHHAAMLMERDARARELSDDAYLRALIDNMPAPTPRDPWRRVTSEDGGFSVELPGAPDQVQDQRDAAGAVSFFIAKSVTGTTMFAGYSDLAAAPADAAQREALLRSVAAGVAASSGATVGDARGLETTQGLPGVLVTLSLDDGRRGAAQLLLDGRRLFQLIAIGPAQTPAAVWTRFFGSFERAGIPKPTTATE